MISRLFWAITLNDFHWCEKLQKGWVIIDHFAMKKKLIGDFMGYAELHEIKQALRKISLLELRLTGDLPLIITISGMQPRLRKL